MLSVETFTSVIDQYFTEPHASLLKGMLFGVSLYHKSIFYEELKRVGLLHLVVLSGMNITLLASMVGVATSRFSKKISLLITTLTIILFIAFVGVQAPIVRAGIMGIFTFVSIGLGRKTSAIYTLVLSALIIGIIWPQWISTISFQLSFGATLGILLFAGKKPGESFLKQELKISLAAQLFAAPIIFFYFRQFSLIAPLANILVAVMVGPLMVLGFITVIMGKLSYVLGVVPAFITMAILQYIVWIVELLSRLPFSYFSF